MSSLFLVANLLIAADVPQAAADVPQAAAEVPQAAPPDWLAKQRKWIALVNSKEPDERATGFVVAWVPRTLYVVTARHAVFDRQTDKKASLIDVVLDPSLCGEPLKNVSVSRDDGNYDLAVLSGEVSPDCAKRIGELHSLSLSSLTALNYTPPPGAPPPKLLAVGRAQDDNIGSRTLVEISAWSPPEITISPATMETTSGGPLFSSRGEIVGMLSKAESNVAKAYDFASILPRLKTLGLIPNLAGVFSELQLAGFPSGATVTSNDDPKTLRDLSQSPQRLTMVPGPVKLSIGSPGYDPATTVLTIPDPGSVARCVNLVKSSDRIVAKTKWPLLGAALGLTAAGGVMAKLGDDAKTEFHLAPSTRGLNSANDKINWSRGLLVAGGVTGLLAISAFAWNRFALSPSLKSSIDECR
jgi:hypothetical protein